MAATALLKWPGWPSSRATWTRPRRPGRRAPASGPVSLGFGQWRALAYALSGSREIAIVGAPGAPTLVARSRPLLPAFAQVVAVGDAGQEVAAVPLADRPAVDALWPASRPRPVWNFACQAPVTEPALQALLDG